MFVSFLTEECLKERASWVFFFFFFGFFAGKELRSADLNPHVVQDSKQDVWGYLVCTAGEGDSPRKTSMVKSSFSAPLGECCRHQGGQWHPQSVLWGPGVAAPCTPPFLTGSRFEQRPC